MFPDAVRSTVSTLTSNVAESAPIEVALFTVSEVAITSAVSSLDGAVIAPADASTTLSPDAVCVPETEIAPPCMVTVPVLFTALVL